VLSLTFHPFISATYIVNIRGLAGSPVSLPLSSQTIRLLSLPPSLCFLFLRISPQSSVPAIRLFLSLSLSLSPSPTLKHFIANFRSNLFVGPCRSIMMKLKINAEKFLMGWIFFCLTTTVQREYNSHASYDPFSTILIVWRNAVREYHSDNN
jgi:hypothetical protein